MRLPVLQINTKAIQNNYKQIVREFHCSQVFPVIKNDAYGLGGIEISKALSNSGCTSVFVGDPEEGIKLKTNNTAIKNIFVLNVFSREEMYTLLDYSLTPVVSDWERLVDCNQFCSKYNKKIDIALQFNIGLNRLGLDESLIDNIKQFSSFNISFIMAHLSNSFIPDDPHNYEQLQKFKKIMQRFKRNRGSLVSSYGLALSKEYMFDIVRPGLLLTGCVLPHLLSRFSKIVPVIKLVSQIVGIRDIEPGDGIGYGQTIPIEQKKKIAIIAGGFGNGLTSLLSDKGVCVNVAGFRAKLIGYVAMELCFVDVTDIPSTYCFVGQDVEIIAGIDDVLLFSEVTGMSAYELISNIGNNSNIKKQYVSEPVE